MTENEQYLALVAEHGRCTCEENLCSEPGSTEEGTFCTLCEKLPHYWPCPHHDENEYPNG